MKGIRKKFAALMLAGFAFGAGAGLVGCTDDEKNASGEYIYSTKSLSNTYFVVSENGVETLHKGDLIERSWRCGAYGYASLTPVLKLNCGKELQTTQFVAYTQGCPKEDKYDEICDCAYELTLPPKDVEKSNTNPTAKKQILSEKEITFLKEK